MSFGQLNRDGQQQPMHEINVTPLVDVMLVLLVLFIVTAPLFTNKIKLNLPEAKTESVDIVKTLVISINAEGNIYLDDKQVSEEQFLDQIHIFKKTHQDTPVELRADGDIAYKKVTSILADLQNTGITKIIFVTRPN